MIKVKHMVVLAVIFGMLSSCGKNPAGPAPDPDWVALTARVGGYRQIYLVDLNDPTHYKRITDNDHQCVEPTFSPDRTQLIYLDKTAGLVHNPQLVLYDIEGNTIDSLIDQGGTIPFPASGKTPVVYSSDGNRIYFRFRAFSWSDDILSYDFTSQNVHFIINTPDYCEWVAGCIGNDTLIVFSNDTATTSQPWGFYFMDVDGNYISRIDNQHLELINVDGVNRKAAYNPEWNDELGLFVFAQKEPNISGFRIAVTDLYGTCYKAYTSGQYMDDHPAWGPGGKVIFFDRRNLTDYSGPYKVMIIDLQTSAVKEFVKPQVIDGATELSFPDY